MSSKLEFSGFSKETIKFLNKININKERGGCNGSEGVRCEIVGKDGGN